jgi:hypothetical protein
MQMEISGATASDTIDVMSARFVEGRLVNCAEVASVASALVAAGFWFGSTVISVRDLLQTAISSAGTV